MGYGVGRRMWLCVFRIYCCFGCCQVLLFLVVVVAAVFLVVVVVVVVVLLLVLAFWLLRGIKNDFSYSFSFGIV